VLGGGRAEAFEAPLMQGGGAKGRLSNLYARHKIIAVRALKT